MNQHGVVIIDSSVSNGSRWHEYLTQEIYYEEDLYDSEDPDYPTFGFACT